jgi:predicted amidophosphoribosyltransferase
MRTLPGILTRLADILSARALHGAALDALAVLAPTTCSGCGAQDRALCANCVAALGGSVFVVDVGRNEPLRAHCALQYGGVARRVLLAVKEGGRTDAARVLAGALRLAVASALDDAGAEDDAFGSVELATIPSTRAAFRARGYHPTELVLHRAGLRSSHPLRAARQTIDQATLGVQARDSNREDSLVAVELLTGRRFLLIDDIVTTGATLREARRAIETAGGRVLAAAALAHTTRMHASR